jgi:hypothetical protein
LPGLFTRSLYLLTKLPKGLSGTLKAGMEAQSYLVIHLRREVEKEGKEINPPDFAFVGSFLRSLHVKA